jgi:glucosamine 6-phosphate synthetase-like amidotransferase/phosphosugar isomerase protein
MLEIQQIMKGNFSSFMHKEIFEQPESVVNTMRGTRAAAVFSSVPNPSHFGVDPDPDPQIHASD